MKFLDLQPDAFGIDISTLSIKVAQLRENGFLSSNVTLSGYGEVSVPRGVIQESLVADQNTLTEKIKKARAKEGIDTNYVIASLPEEKAFLEIIQMPKMEREEIKQAVKYEAENYFPLSMDELYFDSEIITPIENHLDHTDVLITALPKRIVDPYVDSLKSAGLIPLALEIETQAIARALVENFVSRKPLLIIDLGATRTTIMVYSGRALRFTAFVSTSSRQFTKVIAESLNLDFKQAEQLKKKYGLGETERGQQVKQALISEANDFKEQVKTHVDYYSSHSFHEHLPEGNGEISKILLTGGGSNLKGLPEFLSSELGIPTERANPWVNILLEDSKQLPQISFQESLKYSIALGLALRSVQSSETIT